MSGPVLRIERTERAVTLVRNPQVFLTYVPEVIPHDEITERDAADAHPMASVTGLADALSAIADSLSALDGTISSLADAVSAIEDVIAVGWDDLTREAQAIPLQGQSGDPDRHVDGSLLFDQSSVEQCALRYQMPHAWTGSNVRFHVHWSKSTDAAGDVIWQFRYKAWNINAIAPAWSDWANANSRSTTIAANQRTIIDGFPEIDMTGLLGSAMVAVELRRLATDGGDTYAADARLEDADLHYQRRGFGSVNEYPSA